MSYPIAPRLLVEMAISKRQSRRVLEPLIGLSLNAIGFCHPASVILAFLSQQSLLTLRLVSKTFKDWAQTSQPLLLTPLFVSFPLRDNLPSSSLSALYGLAPHCQRLTIEVLYPNAESTSKPTLPPWPALTDLTIIPPRNHFTFQSLIDLRLALEAAPPPRLTHLTINSLSRDGVLGLRSGSFSDFSISGTTNITFWRNLRSLSLSMIPWWTSAQGTGIDDSNIFLSQADKSAFKILHDWLSSFATNQLDHLRFEWLELEDGPNPFLLDLWAAEQAHGKPWFSAPGIHWRMLKAIRVKGVEIDDEGVKEMKVRIRGLKKLEIETAWGEEQVQGGLVAGDKGEWCVDILRESVKGG